MSGGSFFLFATQLDGNGGSRVMTTPEHALPEEQSWLHCNVAGADAAGNLSSAAPFLDKYTANALCAPETRPRFEVGGDSFFVILRGANLNPTQQPEDMVSLRVWTDGKRLVSCERRPVQAARNCLTELENNSGARSAGGLLVRMISRLMDHLAETISNIEEEVDQLEDDNLDTNIQVERGEVITLRRKILVYRRYLSPQRSAINEIRQAGLDWLKKEQLHSLRESFDTSQRVIEELEAMRERLQIIQEELVADNADRLNRNMYRLTVVAAIFLPLGFLTGLMGINVGGMPGVDSALGFWSVAGVCIAVAAVLTVYFKKREWF